MNASLLPHLVGAGEPALGLVSQVVSLFGTVGAAVALRAVRRWPSADPWRITTAWATLGLAVGVLAAVGMAVTQLP